ncbi:uncharacterized protein LOC119982192 isoform X2 [Tripterygium wilfordii]|uniref:uncharacterized protein LOC119982192 isoform X2 n=1 Tax=Tripterygium wilfordii TaxID=458696 RepID=UPI0018F7E65A|nr:uncharacterized protein LOC119982192 isoform X2 [Tripterygium wilfordii]
MSFFIPVFNGQDYPTWMVKMRTFLMSEGLWHIVVHGYKEPIDDSTLDAAEKKVLDSTRILNAKALSRLQNGVGATIFLRIIRTSQAKEAWDVLNKEFEGDGWTIVIKLQNLRHEFENLPMQDTEMVKEFYNKVIDIVNQMRNLGEKVIDEKVVQKMLIILPERYDVVVVAIEELKDLTALKPEQLVGSLEAHEQRRLRRGEQTQSI